MMAHKAVVVHGIADARAALAPGLALTLLSAPGAALFAGCGWWRALVGIARAEHPGVPITDMLDCADAPGRAAEALRIGLKTVIAAVPDDLFASLSALAAESGATVLRQRPPALDLARPGAARQIVAWLSQP